MNTNALIDIIDTDPSLSQREKQELRDKINSPDFKKFLATASGAAVGYALAKFMHLKPLTKVLLSLAGAGAGRMLYQELKRSEDPAYNKENNTYQFKY